MTSPGSSQQQVTCGNGVCVNNVCSAPNTPPDTDFATVISGMEAGREAGVYLDPNTMTLFNGTSASCTDKLGGISNCCNAKGGGANSSNSILMSGVKQFGIGLGKEAIRFLGSSYMYDALYSSDLVPDAVLNAIYGTTMSGVESGAEASFTFGGAAGEAHNFSFYGITYMPGMSPPIGFDPTSFAIAIAIQIVMQYLQCGQSDQLLALRKGQDLCTFIGSYCSTKVLGACVEQKESYCCYNSKLARIINEQGRAQIGKGYGNDIQNPDCSGFTVDQLNQLDFSKMDLSEFTQDIQANSLDTTKMLDRAQQTIQTQNSNYFSQP
jgi:conjugal transfer mating pair stabilization protein TraN